MVEGKKGRTAPSPMSRTVMDPTTPDSARWEDPPRKPFASTVRMDDPPTQKILAPPSTPSPAIAAGIELMVFDERQVPGAEKRPWRAAEVWTKRRVYGLDSTFRCVEILDRETGRLEPDNEMLGARLGGGRGREADIVKFSYPLPLPGMTAMFTKGKKHGYTSTVERMIVRVRCLHTPAGETMPSWEDVASRWSELPPRG